MNTTYVPGYLTFGPRDQEGWPAFMTEEAKEYACDRVRYGFSCCQGKMDLRTAYLFIFLPGKEVALPDCLKQVATWDALYAVAHRALLAVKAEEVWILQEGVNG